MSDAEIINKVRKPGASNNTAEPLLCEKQNIRIVHFGTAKSYDGLV